MSLHGSDPLAPKFTWAKPWSHWGVLWRWVGIKGIVNVLGEELWRVYSLTFFICFRLLRGVSAWDYFFWSKRYIVFTPPAISLDSITGSGFKTLYVDLLWLIFFTTNSFFYYFLLAEGGTTFLTPFWKRGASWVDLWYNWCHYLLIRRSGSFILRAFWILPLLFLSCRYCKKERL